MPVTVVHRVAVAVPVRVRVVVLLDRGLLDRDPAVEGVIASERNWARVPRVGPLGPNPSSFWDRFSG